MKHVVVTGIGTGIGKTVCSGVICEALQADYWKPIQSGDLDQLDSEKVHSMTSNTAVIPPVDLLSQPLSPHEAARIDGKVFELEQFDLPTFNKQTVIEGAGGVLVPLNEEGLTYLDVFQSWDLPLIVISQHYLGSINHTLMTVNTLLQREIEIATIVINGERNEASERVYRQHFEHIPLSYIPTITDFSKENIHEIAQQWIAQLNF